MFSKVFVVGGERASIRNCLRATVATKLPLHTRVCSSSTLDSNLFYVNNCIKIPFVDPHCTLESFPSGMRKKGRKFDELLLEFSSCSDIYYTYVKLRLL